MDLSLSYEIIGYVASALVAISLMMSSILKLRVINLLGAAFFTLYGLLISAYPVAVVNFIIVLIDLYYLREIITSKEYFTLLEVQQDDGYLKYFLTFYDQEIRHFLPQFSFTPSPEQQFFFVLRNMIPAGLFISETRNGRSLLVKLDFVIPGYRDFAVGKFVYSQESGIFEGQGIKKVYTEPGNKKHADYLRRMGFVPDESKDGIGLYSFSIN